MRLLKWTQLAKRFAVNSGSVCECLTGQGDGREAVCEGRAQGVQVLLQEAVSCAFLLHVSFQTLHGGAHALHMLLQRRVTLLILHIVLSQLPQFSLTRYNTQSTNAFHTITHRLTHSTALGSHLYCDSETLQWRWEYQTRSDPLSPDPSERPTESCSDFIYFEDRLKD